MINTSCTERLTSFTILASRQTAREDLSLYKGSEHSKIWIEAAHCVLQRLTRSYGIGRLLSQLKLEKTYLAIARQKCRLSLPFLLDALALLEIRADSFFQLVAEDLDKRLAHLQDPLIREFESTPPTPVSTIFVDYAAEERILDLEISDRQLAKAEPKEILKDISTNLTSLSRIDRIKALLIASKCFRWVDDHSKALICLNAVRGLVGKDFRLLPPAMTEYAYICGEHFGDLQSAVSWSDKSALLAMIHDDDTSALRALIAGGTFSSLQGNFLMARARVTKALDYCESQSFLQTTCFHSMAVISLKLDRIGEAEDWLGKATPLLSENGGKNFGKALWLMGELEARTGRLRSAIVTLDQAFATMESISPSRFGADTHRYH